MKNPIYTLALGLTAILLGSCASTHPIILDVKLVETQHLREQCKEKEISGLSAVKGDSLAAMAVALEKEGKAEAYWVSACAAAHYRLALQQHELEESTREVEALRRDLAAARREVATYSEVLEKLRKLGRQ